jgi:hypothetical protein
MNTKILMSRPLIIKLIFPSLLLLFSFKAVKNIDVPKLPVIRKELKLERAVQIIRIEGDISVVLTNDPAGTVIVEGREKELNKIKAVFEKNILIIDVTRKNIFGKLTLYLSAIKLQTIQLNGDANISSIEFIKSDHLHISLNGNIKVKVKTIGQLSFDSPDDIELLGKPPLTTKRK